MSARVHTSPHTWYRVPQAVRILHSHFRAGDVVSMTMHHTIRIRDKVSRKQIIVRAHPNFSGVGPIYSDVSWDDDGVESYAHVLAIAQVDIGDAETHLVALVRYYDTQPTRRSAVMHERRMARYPHLAAVENPECHPVLERTHLKWAEDRLNFVDGMWYGTLDVQAIQFTAMIVPDFDSEVGRPRFFVHPHIV